MIIAEAQVMLEDALRQEVAEGHRPCRELLVPLITRILISRWRHFYNLVPRSITCTYKVSYAKKLRRLGVLWRNAARLLVFHEALFGPDKLTFISMEEKPYRFNGCGGDKVLAPRGQKRVRCKELRAKLLERWTGITAVFSRRHPSATLPSGGWQPKWTALFRGTDGSRANLVSPSERCQILWAKHGSVMGEAWLKYLRHILPRVDNPEHAIVPVTEWYAPT